MRRFTRSKIFKWLLLIFSALFLVFVALYVWFTAQITEVGYYAFFEIS